MAKTMGCEDGRRLAIDMSFHPLPKIEYAFKLRRN